MSSLELCGCLNNSATSNREDIVMNEKRANQRLTDFNEVAVSVISGDENLPETGISYHYSEDISVSGVRIRGDILLPIDTLLKIDIKLKTLFSRISTLGKVKWIKTILENVWYEVGVEFFNTPPETMQKIGDYISLKQEYKNLYPFNLLFCDYGKIDGRELK